jgi:hypothetical protein
MIYDTDSTKASASVAVVLAVVLKVEAATADARAGCTRYCIHSVQLKLCCITACSCLYVQRWYWSSRCSFYLRARNSVCIHSNMSEQC